MYHYAPIDELELERGFAIFGPDDSYYGWAVTDIHATEIVAALNAQHVRLTTDSQQTTVVLQ